MVVHTVSRPASCFLLSLLSAPLACSSEVSGSAPAGPLPATAGASSGGSASLPLDCSQPVAPRAPLRRLTRFEYNNTVRDLGLAAEAPADALPGEELGNGFGNDADVLGVSPLLIDGYRQVAQQVAERLTGDAARLASLTGCEPTAAPAACAGRFIADLGARAFRRPLVAEEASMLQAVFDNGLQLGGSFATGASDVIEAILQSPQFLYRIELGQPTALAGVARPSDYEMASRLSYLMWGSTPDAPLLAAAAAGQLQTQAQVQAQAERLLADARSHDVVRFFHSQWLGIRGLDNLVRNEQYYPTFRAGMGALFRQETEALIEDVVFQGAGSLGALFSADYSFVNDALATFYGMSGVTGGEFRKVSLDASRRLGLLTHASILSATTPGSRTDPVVRGKWVFTKLLCGVVPDPPPGVPQLAEPTPGISVRERLGMHRANEPCKSCHQLMDPFGFAFENYDGVGLWRDMADGVPVDASSEIFTTDVAGPLDGAVELGRKLGQSVDAQHCYVGRWLTYAYGRGETSQDACSRASLEQAFAAAGGNVKQLLVALTQTDAFLYRPASTAPGGQP